MSKTSQEWFEHCHKLRGGLTTTEQMILMDMGRLEDHMRDIGKMIMEAGRDLTKALDEMNPDNPQKGGPDGV